jgi:hypothetical protein
MASRSKQQPHKQSSEFLIYSDDLFEVHVDGDLDVWWETTDKWDEKGPADANKHSSILMEGAALEVATSGILSREETIRARRLIGEAYVRSFEHNYESASNALQAARDYIATVNSDAATRRQAAIQGQRKARNDWRAGYRVWTGLNYLIGIAALLFSTLAAAHLRWIGDDATATLSWSVAFLTGMLTFLAPDKRAAKYSTAHSILDIAISQYETDNSYPLANVHEAYNQGLAIVQETRGSDGTKRR